jgi:hypothetical protein
MMRFAKWVFTLAAVYGVIVLVPPLFLEASLVRMSGPMTYPEYYYGFTLAALVFQAMFFLIGRDPVRYRPLMIVGVFEKLSFAAPVWILLVMHRLGGPSVLPFATFDLVLGLLFAIAWTRTPRSAS